MKTISREENFVYRDFFTFTAVAWFTGGVISPLTLAVDQTISLQIVVWAVVATVLSLKFAAIFANRSKK